MASFRAFELSLEIDGEITELVKTADPIQVTTAPMWNMRKIPSARLANRIYRLAQISLARLSLILRAESR